MSRNWGRVNTLSDAELHLLTALGQEHFIKACLTGAVAEITMYRAIALEVFINNQQGPVVDALRRVLKCLDGPEHPRTVFRNTPEFDALCKFD